MTTCWAVGRSVWQRGDGTKAARGGERGGESIIPSFVKTRQCDEAAAAALQLYLRIRLNGCVQR